jgi:NAD(P) transhydrogenase
MPAANEYDLIVIGSGPAGQKAALAAAKQRCRVGLIEKTQVVGGVCLHTGTIPSKTLREAVIYFTGHALHSVYGASYRLKERIAAKDLTFRVEHVIRCELDVISNQMKRNGVDMFFGPARFESPHEVVVETGPDSQVGIRGKKFVIAVGTRPARPQFIPFTPGRIIDSDEILQLESIPRTLVVVGGGVIGCEYASIFATLGAEVTLLEQRERILEFADREIVDALVYHMRNQNMTLRLGEAVTRVFIDGRDRVVIEMESGKRVIADLLLFSIGRQGATDGLNLEAVGLKADERGRLTVNECYQTQVEHIYAAGDVIGFPSLASTSMEQGRLAACHALGAPAQTYSQLYPYGIYTIPEISMVGKTEEELTQEKVPYEFGVARYGELARGQIIGDPHGLLKLLFHRDTLELLGVHAIGTRAPEIIHVGQAVMAYGGKVDYFVNTVFNYPTLGEAYKVAAFDGLNKL